MHSAAPLQRFRTLQAVLLRQGILPAAAYWASPLRVFFVNFMGGAWAGVLVTVAAAVGLGFGAHRAGHESALYHLARGLLILVEAVRFYISRFV